MSSKTSNNNNDNKKEEDELEEEFLKCDIDDFPSPKEELKNFQFEVREIMESGCNLQIAEYSLLQCYILPLLGSDKKYKDKKLDPSQEKTDNKTQTQIKEKSDKENNQNKNQKENSNKEEENKYYEEEINKIMEKHSESLEK